MAARVLINLEDVTLRLGGKTIFDAMHMHICEGDKICLVGRNGAGKTTLMRLINAELELDAGTRFAFPGVRIGYLAQLVPHAPGDTVREFVIAGLLPEQRNEEHFHLADMVIAPLALDANAEMGTLSGGQLRRAALARSLVMEPDILLLDEPTNHLDLTAIEWLESYLAAYRGALVCVSHDRAFLTAISQKVFWIDRAAIRTCPKGYGEFDAWMEQIVEHEAKALQNLQKKLAAEIDWTQGGVTARRKRNQRRLNELRRLREKLKNDKAAYKQRTGVIDMDPLSVTQSSKIVAEFKNVSKCFERNGVNIPILNQFHLRVVRGDRIGIIGKNGSGKSTFIRLLTGEMAPDSGHITRGKTVDIRYFDQNRSALDPEATLWSTLIPQGGDYVFLGAGDKKRARHVCGYLKDFLFDPKAARDRVSTLSGGQQNRLLLAKILADPGNVMILDEPTNDLDMDTLDMLQELLSEYQGTLLIVSHDRDFLDRTVTEVLAFEGDAVVEATMGGYSDYLESKRQKDPAYKRARPSVAATQTAPAAKLASTKMTFKLKHELEKLPARMHELRREMESLKTLLADVDLYIRDPQAFDNATRRYGEAQTELDAAELRWLELEELREKSG